MSYISKFKYNEAYSNEDISEALSIITGSGIVPNTPNEILSKYASNGVTYADEQLNVSLSGTTVTVGCGAAIMEGSYIIVYEPETFTVSLTGTYYVYIKYNTVGDISVKCETALPTDNCMLLATVKNGVVTDNRTYATSKINSYGGRTLTKTVSYEAIDDTNPVSQNKKTTTFNLSNINFDYVIIYASIAGKKTSGVSVTRKISGYFKKNNGLCYGCFDDIVSHGTEVIGEYNVNKGSYVKPSYSNGILTVETDISNFIGPYTIMLDIL